MAKELTDYEMRLLREIAREVGIDRHTAFHINRNFVVSVGRIALKFWRQQEARDPDWIIEDKGDGQWEAIAIGGRKDGAVDETLKAYQRAEYFVRLHGDAIRHVIDWFSVAGRENHAWIHNVDDRGRPKKLMKLGSIEALLAEATEQFRRLRHRRHQERMAYARDFARNNSGPIEPPSLTDKDVRFECALDNGLTLARLLTPAALDDETDRMSHCIGYGSYDTNLEDPAYAYYSVRDADDVSLATIEVRGKVVRQFHGPRNDPPEDTVAVAVGNLISARGWKHWLRVYQDYVDSYREYYDLCRTLRMPFHMGAMERFYMLTPAAKEAEVARLREIADRDKAPTLGGMRL